MWKALALVGCPGAKSFVRRQDSLPAILGKYELPQGSFSKDASFSVTVDIVEYLSLFPLTWKERDSEVLPTAQRHFCSPPNLDTPSFL